MTKRLMLLYVIVFAGVALACSASVAAAAPVGPPEISWQMVGTDVVRFQLHFSNPDPVEATLPVQGEMHSQQFGVFLPDFGLIGSFNVPGMAPSSFFDVFFEVPLPNLPPSPSAFRIGDCPPPTWVGNVDVNWYGPGGAGQVNKHYGNIGVCPGGAASCLHVITMCPGNLTWGIVMFCPGWAVTLLNEDHSPAPAILPPGWTGWACITASAGVPVNSQCCFNLNFLNGAVPASINVCAFACECPSPTKLGTWGQLKSLYR